MRCTFLPFSLLPPKKGSHVMRVRNISCGFTQPLNGLNHFLSLSLSRGRGAWEIASSLSCRPAERGEAGGRPRRDNSFYTSANEPTDRPNERTSNRLNFFGPRGTAHLSAARLGRGGGEGEGGARTHALRTSLRPFESVLPSNPIPNHPRNTFRFRLSSLFFSLSHSPRPLPGVVDVEVVLGAPVPLDEAEATEELERLQRGADERLFAGA